MSLSLGNCWNIFDYLYQRHETAQAFATLSLNGSTDDAFYVDFGATSHIINDPDRLQNSKTYKGHDSIFVGNGDALPISHDGMLEFQLHRDL